MSRLLQRELEAAIDGEVRFDRVSRALYSTDASVYQIEPLGVVIPRSHEAVIRAVEIAARHNVSITPRGGGTSQAGQSIGAGLVLDTSKHLNRILGDQSDERHASSLRQWSSTSSTRRSVRINCGSLPMCRRRAAPPWAA